MGREGRPPSDAELAERVRRGGPAGDEALAAWYGRHADGLYGFVYYRVGRNADLAADVVQETFTRAISALGDFDPAKGPMIAWLCTLSRNCIREALRRRGHEPLAALWDSLDSALQRVCDDIETRPLASDLVEARETRELVGMAMANLPEKYRRVLTGKYVEGRSLEEIARETGATVDAVKGILKRARAAFRQAFAALAGARPYLDELGVR